MILRSLQLQNVLIQSQQVCLSYDRYKYKLYQQIIVRNSARQMSMLESQPQSMCRNSTEQNEVAGFIYKTFQILNIEQFQKIIYWAANGSQFIIKDIPKFQQLVLPKYFRHNKMNSFVRQLNMYGFHKIKHNNFKSTFRHQLFQRNKEQLLSMIKRKPKNNQRQQKQQKGQESYEMTPQSPQVQVAVAAKYEFSMKKEDQYSMLTMANDKWSNISSQFLMTTKMINMSLVKVSYNDFTEITNTIVEEECASIQEEMEDKKERQIEFLDFQDPSCFFV